MSHSCISGQLKTEINSMTDMSNTEKNQRTDVLPIEHKGRVGVAWTSIDEIQLLSELTGLQGVVLEVGSASGVTASVLAEMQPDARIVSIDSYPESPQSDIARAGFPDWEHVERMANWRKNRKENQSLFIGTLSQFNRICSVKFDMIFVDAGHLFDEVFSDMCIAEKLLKVDAPMLCHDFNDPNWYQVTEAVLRFCESSGFFIERQVGSIAVLRRITNV